MFCLTGSQSSLRPLKATVTICWHILQIQYCTESFHAFRLTRSILPTSIMKKYQTFSRKNDFKTNDNKIKVVKKVTFTDQHLTNITTGAITPVMANGSTNGTLTDRLPLTAEKRSGFCVHHLFHWSLMVQLPMVSLVEPWIEPRWFTCSFRDMF